MAIPSYHVHKIMKNCIDQLTRQQGISVQAKSSNLSEEAIERIILPDRKKRESIVDKVSVEIVEKIIQMADSVHEDNLPTNLFDKPEEFSVSGSVESVATRQKEFVFYEFDETGRKRKKRFLVEDFSLIEESFQAEEKSQAEEKIDGKEG